MADLTASSSTLVESELRRTPPDVDTADEVTKDTSSSSAQLAASSAPVSAVSGVGAPEPGSIMAQVQACLVPSLTNITTMLHTVLSRVDAADRENAVLKEKFAKLSEDNLVLMERLDGASPAKTGPRKGRSSRSKAGGVGAPALSATRDPASSSPTEESDREDSSSVDSAFPSLPSGASRGLTTPGSARAAPHFSATTRESEEVLKKLETYTRSDAYISDGSTVTVEIRTLLSPLLAEIATLNGPRHRFLDGITPIDLTSDDIKEFHCTNKCGKDDKTNHRILGHGQHVIITDGRCDVAGAFKFFTEFHNFRSLHHGLLPDNVRDAQKEGKFRMLHDFITSGVTKELSTLVFGSSLGTLAALIRFVRSRGIARDIRGQMREQVGVYEPSQFEEADTPAGYRIAVIKVLDATERLLMLVADSYDNIGYEATLGLADLLPHPISTEIRRHFKETDFANSPAGKTFKDVRDHVLSTFDGLAGRSLYEYDLFRYMYPRSKEHARLLRKYLAEYDAAQSASDVAKAAEKAEAAARRASGSSGGGGSWRTVEYGSKGSYRAAAASSPGSPTRASGSATGSGSSSGSTSGSGARTATGGAGAKAEGDAGGRAKTGGSPRGHSGGRSGHSRGPSNHPKSKGGN